LKMERWKPECTEVEPWMTMRLSSAWRPALSQEPPWMSIMLRFRAIVTACVRSFAPSQSERPRVRAV